MKRVISEEEIKAVTELTRNKSLNPFVVGLNQLAKTDPDNELLWGQWAMNALNEMSEISFQGSYIDSEYKVEPGKYVVSTQNTSVSGFEMSCFASREVFECFRRHSPEYFKRFLADAIPNLLLQKRFDEVDAYAQVDDFKERSRSDQVRMGILQLVNLSHFTDNEFAAACNTFDMWFGKEWIEIVKRMSERDDRENMFYAGVSSVRSLEWMEKRGVLCKKVMASTWQRAMIDGEKDLCRWLVSQQRNIGIKEWLSPGDTWSRFIWALQNKANDFMRGRQDELFSSKDSQCMEYALSFEEKKGGMPWYGILSIIDDIGKYKNEDRVVLAKESIAEALVPFIKIGFLEKLNGDTPEKKELINLIERAMLKESCKNVGVKKLKLAL